MPVAFTKSVTYGQNTFISMSLSQKNMVWLASLSLSNFHWYRPFTFPGGRHLTKNDIIASEKNMFRTHGWNAGYFVWRLHLPLLRGTNLHSVCTCGQPKRNVVKTRIASTRVSELATFSCHESFRRCDRTG